MKVLLVGPYPPPHGGVSVHVRSAHMLMKRAGQPCRVLNIQPRAASSDVYIKISGARDLLMQLFRHACDDWTLSVHTNGHNPKSWLISLICAVAAQFGPGGGLTLHSGMVPDYLRNGPEWRRTIARLACMMYNRVVCVNDEIADTLVELGIPRNRLEIKPAYLPVPSLQNTLPEHLDSWMRTHPELLSVTLAFRPEYGFELLVEALSVLRKRHPGLGCIVMGSGDGRAEAEALVAKHTLDEVVFLAGDLDHELCQTVMSRSRLFVRPTFRDGDSISVREAMSLGIPVVASNVGTRPEGTLLFPAGNVNELIARVEIALSIERESLERKHA